MSYQPTTLLDADADDGPCLDQHACDHGNGHDVSSHHGDALASGIAILLVMTVLQRGIGFARNILFCRLLEPDELGRWNLAFNMLVLVAPLIVLGIPGSFGRYVEYYRQRGQLRMFLRRTGKATLALAALGLGILVLMRDSLEWMIFGDSQSTLMVWSLLGTLAFATAFNFLTELLTALKKIRVVSFMQFANSLVFAAIGLLLIGVWRLSTEGVVIAYGAACGTTSIVAMMIVVRGWGVVPPAAQEMSHRDLWSKLMPFAAWMWLTNLLSNMFTAADRYMIVHLSHTDARGACELVGQYHSSRIVPELMVAVAVLISNAALPYLSNDWETGRRSRVSLHQNRVLKLYAIGMTGGSLVLMMVAPWLFHYAMGGKYATGLSVLPWTIMGCIWAGLILVAQNYLWCAERARVASFSLLAGLIINVVLNAWMLPRWGLVGAILATAIANAFTLAAVVYMSCKQGMTLEPTTVFALTLPTILGLGIAQATVVFTLILFLGFSRNWLISAEDWQWIRQQIADRVPSRNMQTTVIGRLQQKTT